jgi:hypothetical protein
MCLPAVAVAAQDTLVVHADNPPVWGAAPRLVEELRIGVLDGDPRSQLGYIAEVVESADGAVWLADRTLGAVRRFSHAGEPLGEVGRRGQGPGEFGFLSGVRLLPDGRVAVFDQPNRRVDLFDTQGQLTGVLRTPPSSTGGTHAIEVDAAGHLYVEILGSPDPSRQSPPVFYWLRLSASGEVLDTVFPENPKTEGRTYTLSLISPLGYRVVARNDEYVFTRPLRDGRIVRIERAWTPIAYEADERRELQEGARTVATLTGSSPVEVPARKPAWSSLDVDSEGRIWVARYARAIKAGETSGEEAARRNRGRAVGASIPVSPPKTWKQPAVYDVIEPTGRYLGTLTIPKILRTDGGDPSVRVALARGMTVWTIEKGELDEQYVVRYRIIPGS